MIIFLDQKPANFDVERHHIRRGHEETIAVGEPFVGDLRREGTRCTRAMPLGRVPKQGSIVVRVLLQAEERNSSSQTVHFIG